MKDMLCKVSQILVIVGAICWGLIGAFQFDLVGTIFGAMSMLSRVVYVLIGVSGVMSLMKFFKKC